MKKSQDTPNNTHQESQTKRDVSQGIENLLHQETKVLDKGFVRVVDYMGNDSAIVQAARVSYGKGTKQVSQDRGLIRYLMRHHHTTPFEMCEIKLHVKLPIFVARQWIRHRTANVNEYSARYSVMDKEFYLPSNENLAPQSQSNMQGRECSNFDEEYAQKIISTIDEDSKRCYDNYTSFLNLDPASKHNDKGDQNDQSALAREIARINLPVNFYTQWYWKTDLHNLFHFLRLRADPHAQYEIREYADKILDIVKVWVPYAYEAFMDYCVNSASVSKHAKELMKKSLVRSEKPDIESSGLSAREYREFIKEWYGE